MTIKRMMAGLVAGVLMLGTVSTACFAASAETTTAETQADAVQSEEITTTSETAANAEKTEDETLPYEVSVDEDGNYTFSFGDWEWSSGTKDETGTDAGVNNKVNDYLNLRSGSGMEYEIIGHLLPGENVQVISEDGDWYQIVIPERTGYVYKDYIDMLEEAEESGIDEEFLAMLLYLMMNSMNQTDTDSTAALTPSGNLTLVDDIGSTTGEGQQFITMVTKSGNYFYLIIDRNEKGEENVHFLNMVDEADLFALMDEDQVAAYKAAQDAAKAEETTTAVTTPSTPTDADADADQDAKDAEVKESTSVNVLPLVGVVMLLAICGGGFFVMQTRKKKSTEQRPDPDADYTEDDAREYEIPVDEDEENEFGYLDEGDDAEEEDSQE